MLKNRNVDGYAYRQQQFLASFLKKKLGGIYRRAFMPQIIFSPKSILGTVAQMVYSTFGKQLCYLYLNSDDDKRKLNVNRNNPDNYWNDNVRFLVVPAPVPAVAPA